MVALSTTACWPTAPVDVVAVSGETLTIAPIPPARWDAGTPLAQVCNIAPGVGVPVPHALVRGSLVLRCDGRVLVAGVDYLVDETWATVGVGDASWPLSDARVVASYEVALTRLDALVSDGRGGTEVLIGTPRLTCPQPPPLRAGYRLVATLLTSQLAAGRAFPVGGQAPSTPAATTVDAVPHLRRRLERGEALRIVCWGDSVTEGAEASDPSRAYPRLLQSELEQRHPGATVEVEPVAVGGSISAQWLEPERWPLHSRAAECDVRRVLALRPDLVTIEFVNDCILDAEAFDRVYGGVADVLTGAGVAVIAITPHRTCFGVDTVEDLFQPDPRPYVAMLRAWADRHGFGIADASARWDQLAGVGLPFTTLLANGINHPDDRGHQIFVEELLQCLGEMFVASSRNR
jgi:hypothetical protein